MTEKGPLNLGLVFLLLVILLVSCSNDCALASPQKLRPSSGWRRKMVGVNSSRYYPRFGYGGGTGGGGGGIGGGGGGFGGYRLPLPPPPPPLVSPPPSPFSMSSPPSIPPLSEP